MLSMQKEFSKNYYDVDSLSEQEKIDKHKTLCLAMQSEISQLAGNVHYHEHRPISHPRTGRIYFSKQWMYIDIVLLC